VSYPVHPRRELGLIEYRGQFIRFTSERRQLRISARLGCGDQFQPVDDFIGFLDNVTQLRDEVIVRPGPTRWRGSLPRLDCLIGIPGRRISDLPTSVAALDRIERYAKRIRTTHVVDDGTQPMHSMTAVGKRYAAKSDVSFECTSG